MVCAAVVYGVVGLGVVAGVVVVVVDGWRGGVVCGGGVCMKRNQLQPRFAALRSERGAN